MTLSDVEIFEALESGILKISPPPDLTQVGPVSIDLHLGPIVHHFKPNPGRGVSVDLSKVKANDWVQYATKEIDLREQPGNKWTLEQGEFALVYTRTKSSGCKAISAPVSKDGVRWLGSDCQYTTPRRRSFRTGRVTSLSNSRTLVR